MKALSIHPYYAMAILCRNKTVEVRSWKTEYRGDILICSTAKKYKDTIPGHALCVATLTGIEPMQEKHIKEALMDPSHLKQGLFAWKLENVRCIMPFPVKGRLSLWTCDHEIEFVTIPEDDRKNSELFKEIYAPLMYNGTKREISPVNSNNQDLYSNDGFEFFRRGKKRPVDVSECIKTEQEDEDFRVVEDYKEYQKFTVKYTDEDEDSKYCKSILY